MLQDQLQFMEMDAGSTGETQMAVLAEVSGNSAEGVANLAEGDWKFQWREAGGENCWLSH